MGNARATCVDGRAAVAVHVRNRGSAAADIRVTTRWGEKKWSKVAPGAAVYHLFPVGKKNVKAGEVVVAAYAWHDGRGYYDRFTLDHGGVKCGRGR